jgi:adenine phosphoribosyltransferase
MGATPEPTLATDRRGTTSVRDRVRRRLLGGFPLVNDHPDVAGVLRDADLLGELGDALAEPFADAAIEVVVAPEARGPMVGALVARSLGVGLVVLRKDAGNHPGADTTIESGPTWRGDRATFIARSFDLWPGARVLVADDWVTTGSSLTAARTFAQGCDAVYVGSTVIVNKATPDVIDRLGVEWLLTFGEAMDDRRLRSSP